MDENVHKGHRERMTERVLKEGFQALNNIEKIEFLLFFTIKRIDTNPLAHALLDHFGSLHRLLEASPYELMQVKGIGRSSATMFACILPLMKEYVIDSMGPKLVMKASENICEYFEALCLGNKYETAYAMYLDKSYRLLKVDKVAEGNLDSVPIYTDRIVEGAIHYGAYYVVLGHNHPSGYLAPSPADIRVAKLVVDALFTVNKYLLDSVIVDHTHSISFADMGIISDHAVIDPFRKPGAHNRIGQNTSYAISNPSFIEDDDD